jgi:hypothetical protein
MCACRIGMAESYTGDATECVQITRFYHATGRRIRSLPITLDKLL